MSGTECLVPFIDNGGQRAFIERRKETKIIFLWDRRSNRERRKIIDRREALNQERQSGPERRGVFQSDNSESGSKPKALPHRMYPVENLQSKL